MRIVSIDDVIDAMSSEYNNGTRNGIDYDQTDAAAFEELLVQVWQEKGWSLFRAEKDKPKPSDDEIMEGVRQVTGKIIARLKEGKDEKFDK